jgi:hypothetical protein
MVGGNTPTGLPYPVPLSTLVVFTLRRGLLLKRRSLGVERPQAAVDIGITGYAVGIDREIVSIYPVPNIHVLRDLSKPVRPRNHSWLRIVNIPF